MRPMIRLLGAISETEFEDNGEEADILFTFPQSPLRQFPQELCGMRFIQVFSYCLLSRSSHR